MVNTAIESIYQMSYTDAYIYINSQKVDGYQHNIVQWGPEFISVCQRIELFFIGKVNNTILEIGSYTGGSLTLLSKTINQPVGTLIAIEPGSSAKFLEGLVKETVLPHTLFHIAGFSYDIVVQKAVEDLVEMYGKVTVLHIDGDHTYEGCMADFRNYYRFMRSFSIIVFHDIISAPGVFRAYSDIKRLYKSWYTKSEEIIDIAHTDICNGNGLLFIDLQSNEKGN